MGLGGLRHAEAPLSRTKAGVMGLEPANIKYCKAFLKVCPNKEIGNPRSHL